MKFIVILVTLCAVFCYGASTQTKNALLNVCDTVTLPLSKLGDKYYYVETIIRANWFSAMHFCNAHNMRLATIMDETENALLGEHLKAIGYQPPYRYLWVSGTDLARQNTWVWSATGSKVTYTNWLPSEPNNRNGKERCMNVVLTDGGLNWNDEDCTDKEINFICEARPPSNITLPQLM